MLTFDARLSTVVESPAPIPEPKAPPERPLSQELLAKMQRYWQAANYLSVGQIYLMENPLLREPLTVDQIKPRLLGHFGTTVGLNFIYLHLNRLIQEKQANIIFIAGPGHGGPALNANAWLEESYSEVHPEITQDTAGMRLLFRQFSAPGGVPSHAGPHTPNSMHEGGELGYSLLHAYGAAFDNPDLIVACVVGDGEAETGPLAGSWKGDKFLNPARDGAVLPILHLNGYKISGPTVLARIPEKELLDLFRGHGYQPYLVEGDECETMHQWFAATLNRCYEEIRAIQQDARGRPRGAPLQRPAWPMIILRSPKGWTGPEVVDGEPVEGTFRAHQVPVTHVRDNPEHLRILEAWLKSYRPEAQFDREGRLVRELRALAPEGDRRMSANPNVNGGRLLMDLDLPEFEEYASYEAFAQIVDSMLAQHSKWLKQSREQPWRRPISSLNVLLTSHVWRQDHNGYTHQAPGFIDGALVQKSALTRIYFPPDGNSLLSVMDHCLRSRDYVNLVTCGKQPQLQWLTMAEAREHCSRGASIWRFAGNDDAGEPRSGREADSGGGRAPGEPDVVLACVGDVPTIETCAAAWLLRKYVPELRVRVVNIVDLGVIMSPDEHPHGMDSLAFESLFTRSVPVLFAFHGYPWVIHSVVHGRANEARFHVRGYIGEGTTTTPFDMVVVNKLSRFHLAIDALGYVPRLKSKVADVIDRFNRKLYEHHVYTREHLADMPEIVNWHWTSDFSEPTSPPPSAHPLAEQSFSDT